MSEEHLRHRTTVEKDSDDGDNESHHKIVTECKVQTSEKTVIMENKRRATSHSDNEKQFSSHFEKVCPKVNCPEKIVICLDLSKEMERPTFRSRSGDKFAPLKLIKRALGIFLQSKHRIDQRHQYALMVIHDGATWMHDFTPDPEDISAKLDSLFETHTSDSFDLGSIFHEISCHVQLPVMDDFSKPPPFTVRAILIYGRSTVVPKFENKEYQQVYRVLQRSPLFFIDAYYIHEPPSEENNCVDAFDVMCDLDERGESYVFEVSRNPTKLYDCMAQLLSHPLQRPYQNKVNYSIESMVPQPQ